MKPLIKYLGGKYNYGSILKQYFPESIKYYYEPFCGSAGMFCFLSENYTIKKVYLNDLDEYLVNFFNTIKTDGSNFLKEYSKLLKKDKAKQFEICKNNLENSPPFDKALFYFFLKEHSFNSIITYLKSGNVKAYLGANKRSIESLTKNYNDFLSRIADVEFSNLEFSKVKIPSRKDTFVFLDPPYYLDKVYEYYRIHEMDHLLVKKYVDNLHKKGIKFMITYNKCSEIEQLYKDYKQIVIEKPARHLRGEGRQKIEEVVIMNY